MLTEENGPLPDRSLFLFKRRASWVIKYFASFFKSDWDLHDYPIRFCRQTVADDDSVRFHVVPWIAKIDRWPQMQGNGDTKDLALEDLRRNFECSKAERALPRPGTGLPLQFASTRHIEAYDDIARDVLKTLYDVDFNECFISDESSLWDFDERDTLDHAVEVVRDTFGADISDIKSGNLVEVFERIRTAREAAARQNDRSRRL